MLLAEPPHATRAHREKAVELMFEKQGVPALFLGKNPVLTSFASGKATSLVVDLGGHGSTITAVRLPRRLSRCVSLAVSPAVSPSSSLPLCLPLRLSHCVSLFVSPTVSPSPSLPLCLSPSLSLCLSHRLSHCDHRRCTTGTR
jgi:hypothetical protein